MSNADSSQEPADRRSRSTGSWALLAILAAVVCIYLALVIGRHALGLLPASDRPGAHPAVGHKLGYLKLQPLTGDAQPVTLDDLHGQTVLLNFWGTWCPPCREEFPHIAALAEKLKNEPQFRLLSVSCGGGADKELGTLKAATEAYLRHEHSELATYSDQAAVTRREVALALADSDFAYPTTILLDGDARILGVWRGYVSGVADQMEQLVDQSLHPSAK